jgi:hypothetical protein
MYTVRRTVEPPALGAAGKADHSHFRSGAISIWCAGAIAFLLLVGAGVVYRMEAPRWEEPPPIPPPVPLAEVPMEVDGWIGEDRDIPSITEDYMRSNFADDYISRRYVNADQRMWADAYLVYCSSRPAGILGHQPLVCFPAHGWIHDGTSDSEFVTRSGRRIESLVHRFRKQAPSYQRVVVLSFYVLNGHVTLREKDFSGFFGRRPNLAGNPARYVAQVQVSSSLEHSARSLAVDLTDSILAILPDRHGQVRWPPLPQGASRTEDIGERSR